MIAFICLLHSLFQGLSYEERRHLLVHPNAGIHVFIVAAMTEHAFHTHGSFGAGLRSARKRFGGANTPALETAVGLIRAANRGWTNYWTVDELLTEPRHLAAYTPPTPQP